MNDKQDIARELIKKANKYFSSGNLDEALNSYEQALDIAPLFAKPFRFIVAEIYLKQKKYQEAVQAYELVVLDSPEHDQAWHDLGVAHLMLMEITEAIIALEKSLFLNPQYYSSMYYCATAYAMLENDRLAADYLDRWLFIKPEEKEKITPNNILYKYL